LLSIQFNTIFNPDGTSRKVRTKWEYNSVNHLSKLTEADDTPNAKITTYTYTPRGELKTTTKPSGCTLTYDYNGLGDLEQLSSSDGTVRHQVRYNKLGVPIWNDGSPREVDPRGRLLSEDFASGLRIENTYNLNGQRDTCTIPMANCLIEYGYCGSDMAEVTRKTLFGEKLYSHCYLKRDLSGNLLQ
jgi:hypothetical protein